MSYSARIGTARIGESQIGLEVESVIVTNEDLNIPDGFEGDSIQYAATVLDDDGVSLPSNFVANLVMHGTSGEGDITVISNQAFDSSVYNQTTGQLILNFTIPENAPSGSYIIELIWQTQID
jgi:hypothetical protein